MRITGSWTRVEARSRSESSPEKATGLVRSQVQAPSLAVRVIVPVAPAEGTDAPEGEIE